MPFDIFQVTAEYSNAVLVAIVPYISDFAKNLDLPIAQPITPAHVRFFGCSPLANHVGGRVVLTNDYEFSFDRGHVVLFRSPNCYFHLQDVRRIPEFYGKVKLTQEEALQIARDAIRKLGYTEAMFHADRPPEVTPPLLITDIGQVGSDSISLTWDAVGGRVYRMQYRDDVASGDWVNATGEISAIRTNTAVELDMDGPEGRRFYRVIEVE